MYLTHWKVIKGGYVMCQKLIRFVLRGYEKVHIFCKYRINI